MSVLDTFSLAGKTAIVTGGAGIVGKQLVRAMAEAGAITYTASREKAALEELAKANASHGDIRAAALDQADEASVLALRDKVMAETGRIDILVNNAVLRPMKEAFQSPLDQFAESMRVNATGLFALTRAIGDVMAAQHSGSIINIGSIQGMIGPDPWVYEGTAMHGWVPDYYFHKGGMINFTRFLASYYGGSGVRCNCLSPGGVQTENHDPVFLENYGRRTFLGRMANDADMMGALVFLGSDASAYITGVNLPVDGGYTAK